MWRLYACSGTTCRNSQQLRRVRDITAHRFKGKKQCDVVSVTGSSNSASWKYIIYESTTSSKMNPPTTQNITPKTSHRFQSSNPGPASLWEAPWSPWSDVKFVWKKTWWKHGKIYGSIPWNHDIHQAEFLQLLDDMNDVQTMALLWSDSFQSEKTGEKLHSFCQVAHNSWPRHEIWRNLPRRRFLGAASLSHMLVLVTSWRKKWSREAVTGFCLWKLRIKQGLHMFYDKESKHHIKITSIHCYSVTQFYFSSKSNLNAGYHDCTMLHTGTAILGSFLH